MTAEARRITDELLTRCRASTAREYGSPFSQSHLAISAGRRLLVSAVHHCAAGMGADCRTAPVRLPTSGARHALATDRAGCGCRRAREEPGVTGEPADTILEAASRPTLAESRVEAQPSAPTVAEPTAPVPDEPTRAVDVASEVAQNVDQPPKPTAEVEY